MAYNYSVRQKNNNIHVIENEYRSTNGSYIMWANHKQFNMIVLCLYSDRKINQL